MSTEHRWSARRDIRIDVSIHYPPIGVVHGQTRNISLEGMFVELDSAEIPQQARLEVSFRSSSTGQTTEHRVPAHVVHQGEGGIGLMLEHTGFQEFDALRYMLNAA